MNENGDDVEVGVADVGPNENGVGVAGFAGSAAFCPKPKGLEVADPNPLNVGVAGFSGALVCCAVFPNGLFVEGTPKLNADDGPPEVLGPNGDEVVPVVEEPTNENPVLGFNVS